MNTNGAYNYNMRRGRTNYPVKIREMETQLAFLLQHSIRLTHQYCVQAADGNWEIFDVRWLGVNGEEWEDRLFFLEPHDAIAEVAKLVETIDLFGVIEQHRSKSKTAGYKASGLVSTSSTSNGQSR